VEYLGVARSHGATQRPQHEIPAQQEEKIEKGDGQAWPLPMLHPYQPFEETTFLDRFSCLGH